MPLHTVAPHSSDADVAQSSYSSSAPRESDTADAGLTQTAGDRLASLGVGSAAETSQVLQIQ
jgi:hypothetical protein